jgi:hypothetical protein
MFSFLFSDLKSNIIKRLKTYSELQNQYDIGDNIYRSGERQYFSKKTKLVGCPLGRTTCGLSFDESQSTQDILEPIWYSTNLLISTGYCEGKRDCVTYSYTPRNNSLVKRKSWYF